MAAAVLAATGPALWVVAAAVFVMLLLGMNRWLRKVRRRYTPMFPGYGKDTEGR